MIEYWKNGKGASGSGESPAAGGSRSSGSQTEGSPWNAFTAGALEAEAAVCTAQAAEASGKTKQEELRRQLIVMTGWQYDDMPRLGEIPIPEEALPEKQTRSQTEHRH